MLSQGGGSSSGPPGADLWPGRCPLFTLPASSSSCWWEFPKFLNQLSTRVGKSPWDSAPSPEPGVLAGVPLSPLSTVPGLASWKHTGHPPRDRQASGPLDRACWEGRNSPGPSPPSLAAGASTGGPGPLGWCCGQAVSCARRVTMADIEKELTELRDSQERGKASLEHSVSEASLYLQDQVRLPPASAQEPGPFCLLPRWGQPHLSPPAPLCVWWGWGETGETGERPNLRFSLSSSRTGSEAPGPAVSHTSPERGLRWAPPLSLSQATQHRSSSCRGAGCP